MIGLIPLSSHFAQKESQDKEFTYLLTFARRWQSISEIANVIRQMTVELVGSLIETLHMHD